MTRLAYGCFMLCMLAGCVTKTSSLNGAISSPSPLPRPVASADEAKRAFDSVDALTKALERRWPVTAIQTFCIPARRHNNAFQNLVAFSRWEGVLHAGIATGFDKVTWYASTNNGRADKYSIGVHRGTDFWLLEIGNEQTLQEFPHYEPDPSKPEFVGNK